MVMTDDQRTGGADRVITSDCPVCKFTAIEESPGENPAGAAKRLAEHINELHNIDEIPEWYFHTDTDHGGGDDG